MKNDEVSTSRHCLENGKGTISGLKHCQSFATFPFPFSEQTHWASQTSGNCYWHKGSWKSPPGARYNATLQRPCNSTRKSTWNPTHDMEDRPLIPGKRNCGGIHSSFVCWLHGYCICITVLYWIFHSISHHVSMFLCCDENIFSVKSPEFLQHLSVIHSMARYAPVLKRSNPITFGGSRLNKHAFENRTQVNPRWCLRSVHPPQYTSKKRSVWSLKALELAQEKFQEKALRLQSGL